MQIAVIGAGFVGVVTAAVFSNFGNSVKALDVDKNKINLLKKGQIPFFEPNLEELVTENLKAKRLVFTSTYKEAIKNTEVIFICVGTPSAADGRADLKYVQLAAKSMAPHLKSQAIVVLKSTVPPSTNKMIEKIIKDISDTKIYTASIPEFLKEGSAVNDALNPERIVIGAKEDFVQEKLLELYRAFKKKIIIMSPQSAQITKYASNAYLATRIAFINEIANICERSKADIEEVIMGLGSDERIGSHYWYPGPGYGGSCFPKDVKELAVLATSLGEKDGLFEKIDELNELRIKKLITEYSKSVGRFKGKTISVLGLSFKPNTNDIREAPSIKFIPALLDEGAKIVAYDPKAIDETKKIFKKSIKYCSNVYSAVKEADIILILIEWDEFKQLNLTKIKKLMKGNIFIDTRNLYNPEKVKSYGFKYIGVGR